MRLDRIPHLLLGALVGLIPATGLVLAAAPASAAPGDVVPSFSSDLEVRADGTFQVRETIDYTFAGSDRHGIYRTIPVVYPVAGEPDLERVIRVEDVRVTSPTGAPTDLKDGVEDGQLVLRIGDADRNVTGTQRYVIEYVVSGALNEFGPSDQPGRQSAELYWNVTGDAWDATILRTTATVRGPSVPPTGVLCFEGVRGSNLPCSRSDVGADGVARFSSGAFGTGEGLTVVVGFPASAIEVPPPVIRERWTFQRAFSVDPVPLGLAVATLVAGLVGVAWVVWSRGRDRRFVGQVPGLLPAAGGPSTEEPKPLFGNPPVVVDFAPPQDVRPGEAGTLIDESADVLDVTATIVDLAVRGYLRIDETGEKRLWFTKRDWTLTRLKPGDDGLKRYERTLFDALFAGRDVVALSALKQTFADDLAVVQKQLYTQVVEDGWFRRRPDSTRTSYFFLGVVVAAAGAGLTYVLARWTQLGLVGIAAVVSGLALLVAGRFMPSRTARGSAALAQLLGFRQYVRTAEAEQIRFEERESVFSRYLPYAIVFGETERWAKAFAGIAGASVGAGAAAGSSHTFGSLPWYGTLGDGGFDDLADSLSSFTTTTAGSVAAAAPSSSSGFGGGGGFSGGGFGGGGGGSW